MAALGELTRKEIADLLGVDQRSITNYQKEDPPIPTRRVKKTGHVLFPAKACVAWFVQFRLKTSTRKAPSELDLARQRKEAAAARKIELEVEILEASQMPTDAHFARLRRICEAMAGAVKGLNRHVRAIRAAESDEAADELAEKMEDEVLKSLQAVADQIPDAEPSGPDGDGGSALAA